MVTARAESEVPYALQEAAVQVCGTVFYFKPPLQKLLAHAGVPPALIRKYAQEPKFVMARSILAELDHFGDPGAAIQRRIVRELVRVTPQDADRQQEAQRALAELRQLAKEEGLVEDRRSHEAAFKERHKHEAKQRQATAARAKGLSELRDEFLAMHGSGGAHDRGYGLESLLGRLFRLHDIRYEPPFRKGAVEQTDGFFEFESFRYLIEARWRLSQPTATELGGFANKVDRKMKSTRGLFVSIVGFRDEVIAEVATSSSIFLMDGQDLMLILDGRVSLAQALRMKIDKASREGTIFYPLARVDWI